MKCTLVGSAQVIFLYGRSCRACRASERHWSGMAAEWQREMSVIARTHATDVQLPKQREAPFIQFIRDEKTMGYSVAV